MSIFCCNVEQASVGRIKGDVEGVDLLDPVADSMDVPTNQEVNIEYNNSRAQ